MQFDFHFTAGVQSLVLYLVNDRTERGCIDLLRVGSRFYGFLPFQFQGEFPPLVAGYGIRTRRFRTDFCNSCFYSHFLFFV